MILASLLVMACAMQAPGPGLDSGSGPGLGDLPNIVFILSDDQRVDTIAAWGAQGISTPSLDRLVRRGTSFRRNYCMGSPHGAVCAPSRAMIHSGRAYHAIDHSGLTDVHLLGEELQARGYRTYGVGKWHNGQTSFKRSFHEGRAVMFGGMSNHFDVPLNDVDVEGNVTPRDRVATHSSDLFAEAAIGFIGEAADDTPYFLSVALTAPHDPRDPPPSYRDRELPPLPANFLPQHPFDNGHLVLRDEKLAAWPREESVVRRQLADYYGLIEHMDAAIGRVLDAIEAKGSSRETVIIFAADHGLAVGSHGLLGKQSVYEHSLRAPLVVVGPGVPEGLHVTALTYLLDIFPTVLGFAGPAPEVETPAEDDEETSSDEPKDDREGDESGSGEADASEAVGSDPLPGSDLGYVSRSLAPLWRGEVESIRSSLYLSMGRTQRAVTDGRWKLCLYPKIGHSQLFDLASDPHESINLAERPAFAHHADRLAVLMGEWRERTGDPDPLSVDETSPFHVDLTGRKRKPDRWQPEWIREAFFDPPEEEAEAPAAAGEAAGAGNTKGTQQEGG